MTDLKVQLSVQVPNGPIFQSTRTVVVAAYETFNVSIPPNEKGDAAAGIDRMSNPNGEGPVKLLLIQSNIYPVSKEAGEIKLKIETKDFSQDPPVITAVIEETPLYEPLVLMGTKVIEVIADGEPIEKISFINTYKLGTALTKKEEAEAEEVKVKEALETAKEEEKAAKKVVEEATETGAKAEAEEKLKAATAKATKAEEALKAATAAVVKATADAVPEKEIADHTAQLSIVIGRDAPAP
jgi:hypothetical protein